MKKYCLLFTLLMGCFTLIIAQNETDGLRKLNIAVYAVERFYVDSVNKPKLIEDAIVGMLKELDPHSTYLDPEEVKEMNEPLQGNFDGIGVQFNMLNDTLFVIATVAGGPSEKVGIVAGDRIVAVNDTTIAGVKMPNSDIMKRLRGVKGTTVDVRVIRRGVEEPIDFKIVRDKIPIYSIDATYMASPKTGYIKLSRFGATTTEEFLKALNTLKGEGMVNLILDLQGNGGGFLTAAIDMTNQFLNPTELIVYTEGRNAAREDVYADKKGIMHKNKLVVLVDESSASASEIVAGAIQDHDRGVIVGRRTFGKGLVQRPVPLPDHSMLRLTVARYFTPSGRSIQKPYEGGVEHYNKDLINRYNKGELTNADSIHFPESERYKTINKQRTVYGGGGIMPDMFVPLDTTKYTNAHRDIVAQGIINQFVTNYFDINQPKLRAEYPDFNSYNSKFEVSQEMVDQLLETAAKEKLTIDSEQFAKSASLIKLQMKGMIARDLFDVSEFYRVMNPSNNSFIKALEIIENDHLYHQILQ